VAKTVNLLARCIRAAGTPTSGILLYRICYWSNYAKVERNGHKWIVKSRVEWMEETCLTIKQYKEASTRLKNLHLIEVQQKQFGTKNLSFVRLKDRGLAVHIGEDQSSLEGPPEKALQGPPECTLTGPLQDHKGDYITKNDCSDYVLTPGALEPGLDKASEGEYSVSVKEDKAMPTVMEMLMAGGKSGKPKSLAKDKSTKPGVTAMEAWRGTVTKVYGGYMPPFTEKMKGQFGLFEKAVPAGKAGVIIVKVVTQWADFVGTVKADVGLSSAPSAPNFDFVLKHAGIAVNFAVKQEPAQKKTVVPAKKPAITPVQSIAQVPAKEKPSKAEVLAILAGKPVKE
jgi:hypothetical protein